LENFQILRDEEIIKNVLEDDNSENEQESSIASIISTMRYDDAMSAFNTCYKWAEEKNVHIEKMARTSCKRGI
jgi:hypothetical protein